MTVIDEYWDRLHKELDKETDRSVAIVAAALVDRSLELLLEKMLIEANSKDKCIFSNSNSPLGSFAAKINACYQLGIISSNLNRDLHILRKIRNDFAHDPFDLTFESDSIESRVIELDTISNYLNKNKVARKNIGPTGIRHDFIFSVGWRLYDLTCKLEDLECLLPVKNEFGYL